MEIWEIILLVIGGYLLIIILYSLFVYLMISAKIGRRTDKNHLLTYYTAEDYKGLNSTPFSFINKDKITLRGKLYERDGIKTDELIVFFHGYGAGHEAYTTLINDLILVTKRAVIAFDYTGCDLSEGKKIPNTMQALADGHDFLNYHHENPAYKDKKLILIGHSWGGFVAANLLPYNKDKKIIRVISINGVTDFALIYKNSARAPYIFIPINNLINSFRYKGLAFATTRKSIKNTPVPHLFLHGLKDDSIPFSPYVSSLLLQSDAGNNVKFHFEKEKHHNIYLTKESEDNLRILQQNIKHAKATKNGEAYREAIMKTDFSKLVENDENILKIIKDFINGASK